MIMKSLHRGLQRQLVSIRRQQNAQCYSTTSNDLYSVARLLDSPPSSTNDVAINGFIRSIRKQKNRSFASIGDGSSLEPLQAILTPEQSISLTTGTAVRLSGAWKPSLNAKLQSHELHVSEVDVLGAADPATFPLQKKYQSPEYLRTMPHIRPRIPFNSLMLRLRSQSIAELTKFFAERDFTQTHPPIITSSDCEGAGEVFTVSSNGSQIITTTKTGAKITEPFFKSPKYLTVSTQLHLEALAQSVGKVWTLSPTFRAEKSDTARHLSEFYMLEAEINFASSNEELMNLVEDMLRHLTSSLYNTRVGQEILHGRRTGESGKEAAFTAELEKRWHGMISANWPRITYTEAINVLQSSSQTFEYKPIWGAGLQVEHERYIAQTIGNGAPVFVTQYPASIKPFYMLPSPTSDKTVECFDLLVPETCEIVGGSMREYRAAELEDTMRRHGLLHGVSQKTAGELPLRGEASDKPREGSLEWYLDLRRWGSVPHGGFGLGFDRLLGYLAGVTNIREVVAFPRWSGRCDC